MRVAGIFVREDGGRVLETYRVRHAAPDVTALESIDGHARIVVSNGEVGVRLPDGTSLRLAGHVPSHAADLLSLDRLQAVTELEERRTVADREVEVLQWRRTDRDLSGKVMIDIETDTVIAWTNNEGRTERLDHFSVEPDLPPLREDALLAPSLSDPPFGHVTVTELGKDKAEVSWVVRVPGLPTVYCDTDIQSRPLREAFEWARQRACSATVWRQQEQFRVFDLDEDPILAQLPELPDIR